MLLLEYYCKMQSINIGDLNKFDSFNAHKFTVGIDASNKRQESQGERYFISCMKYIFVGKNCKKKSQRNNRNHKKEKNKGLEIWETRRVNVGES